MREFHQDIRPEDKVILTVDAREDIIGLNRLSKELGQRVHAFKLGQSLFLQDRPWAVHGMLKAKNINTMLDAKYEEDPDQMTQVVKGILGRGVDSVSIAPASGVSSLIAAAKSTPDNKSLFITLPSSDNDIILSSLDNVQEANSRLDRRQQIERVMCNIGSIETVKRMGNFTVIATGIRMPGHSPNDHPEVATPSEAIKAGADLLAIGRQITAYGNYQEAYTEVMSDIEKVVR